MEPTRSVPFAGMGLLDDAIREHLELLRLHGAAPEEIKRREQEALGPIRRRGEYASDVPEPDHDAGVEPFEAPPEDFDERPFEPADEAVFDEQPTQVHYEHAVMPEPAGHEPVVDEAEPPVDEPLAEEVDLLSEGPGAVPMREEDEQAAQEPVADGDLWLGEPGGAPGDLLEPPGDATTAFSADEVAAARGEQGDTEEDVLEETPDFLQETPEHDRLWFEQRPPRRFDFDE